MTTLSAVISKGLLANLPTPGTAGSLYFATDTGQTFRDNGIGWDNLNSAKPAVILAATPSEGGPYTIAHGLSATPSRIVIVPTSAGSIWKIAPLDSTNVYLFASDPGITADVQVFA